MTEHPEYLYRYRHLQNNHREYTRRILTDSILYFASPSAFNDPFDCRVHFEPVSIAKLKKKYEKILKNKMPVLNREGRRAKARSDAKEHSPKEVLQAIKQGMQEAVSNHGILSLSATDRNILLWSHYAAGHTGLCLQFSCSKSAPFFKRALPVKYSQKYPKVELITSGIWERAEALLLTKASDWSYEEEWRIIDPRIAPGEKRFPEELLTGVILGARMSLENRDTILKWLENRKTSIKIYETVISDTSFSLSIVPYSY